MISQNKLHTNTFTYRIILRNRKQNKKGQKPIYFLGRLNKKTFMFSLGIKLNSDEKYEMLESGRMIILPDNEGIDYKNEIIRNIIQKAKDFVKDANTKDRTITIKQLKAFVLNQKDRISIFELMKSYYLYREKLGNLTATTLNKDLYYINTWEGVAKNFGFKSDNLYPSDLTLKFAHEIVIFMRTQREPTLDNLSIKRTFAYLKNALDFAVLNEEIKQNPLADFYHKGTSKKDKFALTESEVKAIIEALIKDKAYERIRDLFLFMLYTGITHVDVKNLSSDKNLVKIDQNNTLLVYERQKMQNSNNAITCKVPLLPIASQILAKYEKLENLPYYVNGVFNKYIKAVCEIAGLSRERAEKVKTHTARKTFITLALNNWHIPLETVAAMVGHATTQTTLTYYTEVNEKKITHDTSHLTKVAAIPNLDFILF